MNRCIWAILAERQHTAVDLGKRHWHAHGVVLRVMFVLRNRPERADTGSETELIQQFEDLPDRLDHLSIGIQKKSSLERAVQEGVHFGLLDINAVVQWQYEVEQ